LTVFGHDYVEKYNLPNFKKLISNGAAAEALIPSFPSKTFPNHYTLGHRYVSRQLTDWLTMNFTIRSRRKYYTIKKTCSMVEDILRFMVALRCGN
jgi:hypothetical protein